MLTIWRPLLPYGYSYKASCVRPGLAVICNFWHLGIMTECQSARMSKITKDGLTLSGTGCFIAVKGLVIFSHNFLWFILLICFADVSSCAQVCRRLHQLTSYQPLWRRQCLTYWDVHESVTLFHTSAFKDWLGVGRRTLSLKGLKSAIGVFCLSVMTSVWTASSGEQVITRVGHTGFPTPPGKSWKVLDFFSWKFQDLESPGKALWYWKVLEIEA